MHWKIELTRLRRQFEGESQTPGADALAFKSGPGGLLDADFIARMFCLERGWHEPGTLRALERVRQAGALSAQEADALLANYRQLRRLEGILCRWSHAGEGCLPEDTAAQHRVAVRCGFASAAALFKALAGWRAEVRRVFLTVLP